MLTLVKTEALAYLKLGLLAPSKKRIRENGRAASELGVLFVPGVGANGSQFHPIKRALRKHTDADYFDAFEYLSMSEPKNLVKRLRQQIDDMGSRCEHLLLVGHSLGGLLVRMVLQAEDAPASVDGYVSLCAPLHGTWRSKLAPFAALRALAPDSAVMREVYRGSHRLDQFPGPILTVGARHDQFIEPYTSAFLEGHPQLHLIDVGHAGSLFSESVHRAIGGVARRIGRSK